jgi:hypothetical protein
MIPGRELPNLRALTLIRPWSDAIVCGPKRVENRSWLPPPSLIGCHVAIHAGQKYDDHISWPGGWWPPGPSIEGIVGVARLAGVLDLRGSKGNGFVYTPAVGPDLTADERSRLEALDKSPWWVGPVGFFLTDVVRLPDPVECKGALYLWDVPCGPADRVREQWIKARAKAA